MNIIKSKRISSWVIIIGSIIFIIPFFQILGLILLGIGTYLNYKTNRTKKQKIIWALPLILCSVLGFVLVMVSKWM
jgi:hypothetical protein